MNKFASTLAAGLATLAGLIAITVSVPVSAAPLSLNAITTPIVPTAAIQGDRDFGGNGPIMVAGVELSVGRNGRAIFAAVTFSARETGGDGSSTFIGPVNFEVWRWTPANGANFVHAINTNPTALVRIVSGPGCGFGCGTIGPAEDGGLLLRTPGPSGGLIRQVTWLGDTSGDDISTDANPHGDTSIRRIDFNTIDVTFGPSLL